MIQEVQFLFTNPDHSVVEQVIGTVSIGAFAFVFSFIVMMILKATMGIRVSKELEEAGMDIEEHGAPAYTHSPGME